MRTARLQDMTKGWFVGDFSPTLHPTREVEVAVKHYRAGDAEGAHLHKIAREFTVIVSGTVRLNGRDFGAGDIIVIEPGEAAEFLAVTDAVTTVVKIPGAPNDKYPA
jgi:mannose-6-phosphate isomerase-like protein (cupin superfamily)